MELHKTSLLFLLLMVFSQGGRAEIFKKIEVDVDGVTCRCFFVLDTKQNGECKFTRGRCQATCNGGAEGLILTGEYGNKYTLDIRVTDGVVALEDCSTDSGSDDGGGYVEGGYNPGEPGAAWTEEEVLVVKAKLWRLYSRWDDHGQGKEIFSEAVPGANCGGQGAIASRLCPEAPKMLRLGFHDCLKYKNGGGGCDGCLNWTGVGVKYNCDDGNCDDVHEGDNNGLEYAVLVLDHIYTKADFPNYTPKLNISLQASGKSRADLWAFATIVAVEHGVAMNNYVCDCGGGKACPKVDEQERHRLGMDDCKVELPHIVFKTGRRDCIVTNPERPYEASEEESHASPVTNGEGTVEFFKRDFGMTGRETVAILGAHTMGRLYDDQTKFAYLWQTNEQLLFNNQYYRKMTNQDELFIQKGQRIGNAFGEIPKTRWMAVARGRTKNGGPVFWIHEHHVCNVNNGQPCSVNEDQTCCRNRPEGTDCVPDRSFGEEDPEINSGCESFRFITGLDEIALSAEMGLYKKFNITTDGIPFGCEGFETFDTEHFGQSFWYKWSRNQDSPLNSRGKPEKAGKMEPRCPLQDLAEPTGSEPLHTIFEEYAENQSNWVRDFSHSLEKMLGNGYNDGELVEAPDQWTEVQCSNGFEGMEDIDEEEAKRYWNCWKNQGPSYYIVSKLDGRVLQMDQTTEGRFQVSTATGEDHQKWRWFGESLVNVEGNDEEDQLLVDGYRRWTLDQDGHLSSSPDNKVLGRGVEEVDGLEVGLYGSGGTANTQWFLKTPQTIFKTVD